MPDTSLRITYVGHATTLVEMDGVRVLTDPLLRRRVVHLRRLVPLELSGSTPFGGVDGILVSHLHFDHFDPHSLEKFDRGVTMVVPFGGAVKLLERRAFTNVRGADEGLVLHFGPVEVRAMHAQHPGSRGTPGMNGPALGYVLQGSETVYFAGDTDIFPEMAELSGVDVALLPVAGWGPRLPEGDHLNPLRAAEALKLIRPRVAIPIHWGTYAPLWAPGGYATNQSAPAEFQRFAAEVAPQVDVRVLDPGQSVTLPTATTR